MNKKQVSRIIIWPPLFNILLDIFCLVFEFWMICAIIYKNYINVFSSIDDYIILIVPIGLFILTLISLTLGDKIVIQGNNIKCTSFFFINREFEVTEQTRIIMGERDDISKVRRFGWKLSNNHSREKLWVPSYSYIYNKRVMRINKILESLTGKEIKISQAKLKF